MEDPRRPIMLAGLWQTPIEWPLLDVIAAAHLALVDVDARELRRRRTSGAARDGAIEWPARASVAHAARRALEHRVDEPPRLRVLVRDVERELYFAAALWATAADCLIELGDRAGTADAERAAELQHTAAAAIGSCRERLVTAAGRALGAAVVAPDPGVAAGTSTWANLVNRYYN